MRALPTFLGRHLLAYFPMPVIGFNSKLCFLKQNSADDRSMEVEALSHLGNVFLRAGEADKSIEYQIEASKLSSMSPRKVPGDTPKLPPPVPLR
mmetsp:Transcript_39534/g.101501  ORF Transcript_39534/g.101501 Transcript_39534/m.101501 type:complete len:94 (-) Transcript_39534:1535-1816(-)